MANLKALFVILCLSLPVFWIAEKFVCEFTTNKIDFLRRRNLWIALTVLAFASHSYWVYVIGAILIIAFGARQEKNRLALFAALMMAVPSFGATIEGFAGIQQFVQINHLRLMSALIFIPAYVNIRRRPGVLPFGRTTADKLLFAYIAMQLTLQFSVSSMTALARYAIYSFLEVFLPYYIASRGLKDFNNYRETFTAFFMAVMIMAPVAIFEYARHWLLYSQLAGSMGLSDNMGSYMGRSDSLRAQVSAGHSIALGYAVVVALGLLVYVQKFISSRILIILAVTLLIGTLVATGARGPWVGSAAVLAVVLLTGPGKFRRLIKGVAIVIPVIFALSFTTFGQDIFDALPFIGTVDVESIDYRQRLFDISMVVIWQHPFFGVFDYLVNPLMQELIQGDGIIDVVNSFLGVALTYGFIGLGLFCGIFACAGLGVRRVMRQSENTSEWNLLGRSLMAILAGILITIVTVSSISFIPWIYWIVVGLCVGFAHLGLKNASNLDLNLSDGSYSDIVMPNIPFGIKSS